MKVKIALVFGVLLMFAQCTQQKDFDATALRINWRLIRNNFDSKGHFLASITFVNNSLTDLPKSDWRIYFNLRYHSTQLASVESSLKINHVNGDLFLIEPGEQFQGIESGDSIVMQFQGDRRVANFQDVPSGFFWVNVKDSLRAVPLPKPIVIRDPVNEALLSPDPSYLFTLNDNAKLISGDQLIKIFPTPREYRERLGVFVINKKTQIVTDDAFDAEANLLAAELNKSIINGITLADRPNGGNEILLRKTDLGHEAYRLIVEPSRITIYAGDNAGAFYGIQSLKTLMSPAVVKAKADSIAVPALEVNDLPRFPVREFMLDVARNFETKENVKRLIDVMALYKMNVFHFHFSDDEGWRLEIPGLPELTDVGARRGYPFQTGDRLQPSYGSGPEGTNPFGTGFYTREDFIEILRYATERHVEVVPEIESPGHARAAIVAMEARYRKLAQIGNLEEALRYRLADEGDRSKYVSAQLFTDNVMNAALPSTYEFIEKVIVEIKNMYRDAGAPLRLVHMGGDEVPAGAWEKSPVVQSLMKEDLSIHSTTDLWRKYFDRVSGILKKHDLKPTGWEELVIEHGSEDGSRMVFDNQRFRNDDIRFDSWWNVYGNEDVAYKMANKGYKVVLTFFDYFYFDLANTRSFSDPGDGWVGYLGVDKTFSFIPLEFYRNATVKMDLSSYPPDYFQKKERLTPAGRRNILGIQGALWSENMTYDGYLDYQVLPRLLALAERGWSPDPSWSSESDPIVYRKKFDASWSMFANTLGQRELPRLDYYNGGYRYRVSPPGARVAGNVIIANVQMPGQIIRYTSDGREPDSQSPIYSGPIPATPVVKLKAFSSNDRSSETVTVRN